MFKVYFLIFNTIRKRKMSKRFSKGLKINISIFDEKSSSFKFEI